MYRKIYVIFHSKVQLHKFSTEIDYQNKSNLESVIQSEVRQKEKNKYHMLTNIYGLLKKNGSEEPRGRTGIKTQT